MSVTQRRISGRIFLDYVIALLAAWLAFIVRQAIVRYVGHEVPTYIVFYPAIMLAALPGGLGPGLLSTAAAALLTIYYILPPHGQFAIQHSYDAIAVGLFCAMGVFISVVSELYRRKR
jgi:K+-sensing histidine kinase KdpD